MKKTEWLELFCGGGGAGVGLALGGATSIHAVDVWPEAIRVHAANVPGKVQVLDLLDTATWHRLPAARKLWASPPCQDHSKARRGKPSQGRDGWPVVRWYARTRTPALICVENVPGAPWKAWEADLVELGYTVRLFLVNAADFGVPQNRRRGLLLASKSPRVSWPVVPQKRHVSLGDALPWLYDIESDRGGYQEGLMVHPEGGYDRRWLSRPAPTVTCQEVKGTRAHAPTWKFNGGPDRASDAAFLACGVRRLAPHHLACLQGFPEDYDWLEITRNDQYKMIGNAVPPALSAWVSQWSRHGHVSVTTRAR